MGQNSIISSFFARRAKKASAEGRSPPQELEVSSRSGLYPLVSTVTMLKLVLVVQLNFIVQHHVMAQLPAVVQLLTHTEPKHELRHF